MRREARVSSRKNSATTRPRRPAPTMTQKISRQSPNTVTRLPASGARMGETLKTSISRDISCAAAGPVCRSRDDGAGDDDAGAGAHALQEAEADEPVDRRRQRAADRADDVKDEAQIERPLAAEHVGKRSVDDLRHPPWRRRRKSSSPEPHGCRHAGSPRWSAGAGRYMSRAKSPIAESSPSVRACEGALLCIWKKPFPSPHMPCYGTGGRR